MSGPAPRLSAVLTWVRTNGAGTGLEIVVNGVLPFVIYSLTDARLGDVGALIASAAPPVLWSIVEFVRRRRVDALSILVLTGIVFSLVALAGGGGAKFLQLRENLVTGAIGLIFLGSAAIRRPLIFYLARATMLRNAPDEWASFEERKETARFKRTMTIMTLVWGLGLVARTAAACALVFSVPIPTYLLLHPILGYASMGALGGWTFWFARRQRRLGAAERAAREAGAGAAVTATV
jgi:intracellular septation protein A